MFQKRASVVDVEMTKLDQSEMLLWNTESLSSRRVEHDIQNRLTVTNRGSGLGDSEDMEPEIERIKNGYRRLTKTSSLDAAAEKWMMKRRSTLASLRNGESLSSSQTTSEFDTNEISRRDLIIELHTLREQYKLRCEELISAKSGIVVTTISSDVSKLKSRHALHLLRTTRQLSDILIKVRNDIDTYTTIFSDLVNSGFNKLHHLVVEMASAAEHQKEESPQKTPPRTSVVKIKKSLDVEAISRQKTESNLRAVVGDLQSQLTLSTKKCSFLDKRVREQGLLLKAESEKKYKNSSSNTVAKKTISVGVQFTKPVEVEELCKPVTECKQQHWSDSLVSISSPLISFHKPEDENVFKNNKPNKSTQPITKPKPKPKPVVKISSSVNAVSVYLDKGCDPIPKLEAVADQDLKTSLMKLLQREGKLLINKLLKDDNGIGRSVQRQVVTDLSKVAAHLMGLPAVFTRLLMWDSAKRDKMQRLTTAVRSDIETAISRSHELSRAAAMYWNSSYPNVCFDNAASEEVISGHNTVYPFPHSNGIFPGGSVRRPRSASKKKDLLKIKKPSPPPDNPYQLSGRIVFATNPEALKPRPPTTTSPVAIRVTSPVGFINNIGRIN